MLYIVQGDLLKSDCDIIAHQANCQSIFGGGIAKQIKAELPEVYAADKNDPRTPQEKFGGFSVALDVGGFTAVFNLYGQFDISYLDRSTNYFCLANALGLMCKQIIEILPDPGEFKIGLPYRIGCGLGGGDWEIVKAIIEDVFTFYGLDCYLFEYP